VPCENNRAERELRPTVIARKVSFGSQTEDGAKTRQNWMSILHSLKKRGIRPQERVKQVLDKLALNPEWRGYVVLTPGHFIFTDPGDAKRVCQLTITN